MAKPIRRMVVGYDGSEHAQDGLALARALAELNDVSVVLAAVVQTRGKYAPIGADQSERALLDEVESQLEQAATTFGDKVKVETKAMTGSPARELHHLAEETKADVIVLGPARLEQTPGQVRPGTVGDALLHGAPSAVAVAERGLADRDKVKLSTIGVAVDGSTESPHAIATAARLAKAASGELRAITVVEAEPEHADASYRQFIEREREHGRRLLDDALAAAPKKVRGEAVMLTGSPTEALEDYAADHLDLLVLGSRSYGPVGRVMLGGVTSRLSRSTPSSVFLLPRGGIG
jgi:nucleotide-binding universal stress UspA family protein